MNRTRNRFHLSLLIALLLVLANLALRPAKASQAAQTPAPTDQTDTSATKSKKKKKTATTEDTAAADSSTAKKSSKSKKADAADAMGINVAGYRYDPSQSTRLEPTFVGWQGHARPFAFEPELATAGCLARTRQVNDLAQLIVMPLGLGAVLACTLFIFLPRRRSLHGDARFATRREIQAAGLLGDEERAGCALRTIQPLRHRSGRLGVLSDRIWL